MEGSKVSSFRKAGRLERTSLLFPSAVKGLCTFISSLDIGSEDKKSMNPIVEDPPSPERSLEEEEDEEGECELVVDRGAAE